MNATDIPADHHLWPCDDGVTVDIVDADGDVVRQNVPILAVLPAGAVAMPRSAMAGVVTSDRLMALVNAAGAGVFFRRHVRGRDVYGYQYGTSPEQYIAL